MSDVVIVHAGSPRRLDDDVVIVDTHGPPIPALSLVTPDHVTIGGDGTAYDPLHVIPGSVVEGIDVDNQGAPIASNPHTILDFEGAGVTAANAGGGRATITIPGGGGVSVQDQGAPLGSFTTIDFTGAITATNAGGGVAQATVTGGSGYFGSGIDGPIHVINGQTLELSDDFAASAVTVDAGGILHTNGNRITSTTPIVNNGEISCNGRHAINNNLTSIQNICIAGDTYFNNVGGVENNGSGVGFVGNSGINPFGINTGTVYNGGAGGAGIANAGGAGGATVASDVAQCDSLPHVFFYFGIPPGGSGAPYAQIGTYVGALSPSPASLAGGWGASGGSGGGAVGSNGGWGAGPGGVIGLFAPSILGTGVIHAIGGQGADQSTPGGNAGGGGGGSGGLVIIGTATGIVQNTIDVSGGAGGAGLNPGHAGDPGLIIQYRT